ncbi:NUDIX hydrolase [Desulfoplanes sp.]
MNTFTTTPTDKKATAIVEVVDKNNRPLGGMHLDDVRRQGLFTRMALLLMYDKENKLCLQKRKDDGEDYPGRLDFAIATYVRPGESAADGLLKKMPGNIRANAFRLRFKHTTPPGPATGRVFIDLFRMQQTDPSFANTASGEILKVDRDEVAGLVSHCPELLTPYVIYFWSRGDLFSPV